MRVDAFDFDLPSELIAQRPALPRDAARLLVVNEGKLQDRQVRDLPEILRPGDLLVFNDTRVLPARLAGRRRGGAGAIEVTLHERINESTWRAFARPARRCVVGERLEFAPGFSAIVTERGERGEVTLSFEPAGEELVARLERYGVMPLPPYIRRPREGDPCDREDYQTMFARHPGAVAAPTAALHFTPVLMNALEARGIGHTFLTLHVGAGTFLPVRTEDTEAHEMHAERYVLTREAADAIAAARARGGRVVAIGTTVLRTLETQADEPGRVAPGEGATRLFITPGYRFRVVDLLLTNFHLPRSTLFMLVAAFSGLERMQGAYRHAIEAGYRFYSYGDACLLKRTEAR